MLFFGVGFFSYFIKLSAGNSIYCTIVQNKTKTVQVNAQNS